MWFSLNKKCICILMFTGLKIEVNVYLDNLKSIPTGASTLPKIIAFNNEHASLERPAGYEDQST